MWWPAVAIPAGRGTAGMRGSVREGSGGRRFYAPAARGSGEEGVIKEKEGQENQEVTEITIGIIKGSLTLKNNLL